MNTYTYEAARKGMVNGRYWYRRKGKDISVSFDAIRGTLCQLRPGGDTCLYIPSQEDKDATDWELVL